MRGHYCRTLFGFLLCLLITLTLSACGEAEISSERAPSPVQRKPLVPAKVSSTPRPEHPGAGVMYVATEPAVGDGGMISAFLIQNGRLLWRYQTDVTYLSVALDNGVIYAEGSLLSAAGQARVYALSAADGTFLWSEQIPGEAFSAPLIDHGTAYFANSLDGTVYAVRCSDGAFLWETPTGVGDTGSSPLLLSHGRLFVRSHASGTLVSLESRNGGIIWRDTLGQQGIANLTLSGETLYFLGMPRGTAPGVIHAVRSANGAELWHRVVGRDTNLTLAFAENALYLSRGENELVAMRASDGALLWKRSLLGVGGGIAFFQVRNGVLDAAAKGAGGVFALRASDGLQLWRYQNLQLAPWRGITYGVGEVYVISTGSDDGNVYAFEAMTGLLLWHFSIPFGGNLLSTVSITPGAVIVAQANTGKLYVLRTDGKESWVEDLLCPYSVAPFPIEVGPE